MEVHEVNFDGLVGPTHNYAGLSHGNLASMTHKAAISNPRAAALQGLAKMKLLADLGVKQAILPPHERPHLPTLRQRGYTGSDAEILAKVAREDPLLLARVSSSSAMWAANAATVSPSADTLDARVHFTPANLVSNAHRAIEAATTSRVLRAIFSDETRFVHHDPLPEHHPDEGAANHTRLAEPMAGAGLEIFTWGFDPAAPPRKFRGRQMRSACQEIARFHGLRDDRTFFVQQNPIAIDAGAFHNDVVAVGHGNVLLYHELAWVDGVNHVARLQEMLPTLKAVAASADELSLTDAIASYVFNSQLVTVPNGGIAMIAPLEARENERSHRFVQQVLADNVISAVHFIDVRQSMHNGGGPACLRLRVLLTADELAAVHPGVLLDGDLFEQLRAWIERHYREELRAEDLADPRLLEEGRSALDELTAILRLPGIYDFQR